MCVYYGRYFSFALCDIDVFRIVITSKPLNIDFFFFNMLCIVPIWINGNGKITFEQSE